MITNTWSKKCLYNINKEANKTDSDECKNRYRNCMFLPVVFTGFTRFGLLGRDLLLFIPLPFTMYGIYTHGKKVLQHLHFLKLEKSAFFMEYDKIFVK